MALHRAFSPGLIRAAGAPVGVVSLDAFTAVERASSDPWAGVDHVQGALANYALVMLMHEANVAITSLLYGGVAMNVGPTVNRTNFQFIRAFYLDSTQLPAAGTKSVVVDPAGSLNGAIAIWTLIGAALGAPNRNNPVSGDLSVVAPSLASVPAGAAIISGTENNNIELPSLSGGTQRFVDSESSSGHAYGVGDSFPGAPGTITHTWTGTAVQRRTGLMLEILPA